MRFGHRATMEAAQHLMQVFGREIFSQVQLKLQRDVWLQSIAIQEFLVAGGTVTECKVHL